uniref:Uncharacterized protein n=1 Tax=Compsopogon caeruleus TaxID=31354 RepID=A0A6T6C1Z4_9RHOD|mmetsp:Transcript_16476/g.33633  ORF Transcript_16476/g.33633 Transcript_16476/m.33633 type:complete len:127 (+) Transcript_16476:141-521(+)|eukprot:CAMPEP_0184677636 /NCGR_PEP_ID=MMETSP0312-20130426/214_1 /TAXON_ID=31354 /ORGANISM="Compsopogon coeruleus, Strain SAG 36.94" /LENGTH=126 /DNA_ID=CAMNT_0027125611 /DNA_START=124 /DNA_END=504 /DNA_ORIENTATION=-
MAGAELYGLLRRWVLSIHDDAEWEMRASPVSRDQLALPPALPPILPVPGLLSEDEKIISKRRRDHGNHRGAEPEVLNTRMGEHPEKILQEHMIRFKKVKIDHLANKAKRLKQSEDRLKLLLGEYGR